MFVILPADVNVEDDGDDGVCMRFVFSVAWTGLIYFGTVLYFVGDLDFVFHGGETQGRDQQGREEAGSEEAIIERGPPRRG